MLPIWLVTSLPIWLVIFIIAYAIAALYVAIKYREVRKFLAGAFFVSSGILWYLWVTDTSLPIVLPYAGTISVETPNISGQRAIVHFILFVLCLYFGFSSVRRKKTPRTEGMERCSTSCSAAAASSTNGSRRSNRRGLS
jgi:hypothetical protein